MGLTSALNTSLNGLTLNETTIDVLGNNIANAGTNGFKASNVLFTTQLSRTLSVGSRPNGENGGTNPRQIGLGATEAAISKDFTQGSITNSTSPSDLAIQGGGFFIMDGADGNVYSRNGNFSLNSSSKLVNGQGLRVQGFGVDKDFTLVNTQLVDISIPLGSLNVAQQTKNVAMSGALLPTGDLGTQGSLLLSEVLTDTAAAGPATAGSALTDIQAGSPAANLFTAGQTLTFTGRKGGRTLDSLTLGPIVAPTGTFPYTGGGESPGTTLGNLLTMFDEALGIHSGGTIQNDPNSGGQPGVTVDSSGRIQIVGNRGTVNDLDVTVGDLTMNGSTVPLTFAKSQSADGESTVTDFVVFDSLGEQINVKMSGVLDSRTSTSTTYRYFIESFDDSDTDTVVSSGTIQFDSSGKIISGGSNAFSIDRNNTAAVSPMQITVDFTGVSGISSKTAGSTLSLSSQDGSDPGTLTSFVIAETGIINGVFDNGIIRKLGQLTLAKFSNPQGLVESGSGTFQEGVSSGPPLLATPGNFGAGTVRAGAIELSNTDVGRNLVDLIVASTNYRGNARVISSIQQLVDELLVLGR